SYVAVDDFNGDGFLDLVVAYDSPTNATANVLLGNGDGSFQARRSYPVGARPVYITVADFNGDGVPVLVTGNYQSNDVSVLLGNGDGSFRSTQNYRAGARPVSVGVGDFNSDGVPDLVVANENSGPLSPPQVSLLLGNGDGSFRDAVTVLVGVDPGGTRS